jgi:murein DD-endopeptidase MepM/ murein hydrolase activator NlpD
MNDVWAWDFRMPSGVPIVAAADGMVRMSRGDSTRGGCDPSFAPDANYVIIAHADDLETQYLHLETVVVAAGDKVKAGDLIGYSGKTGWACGSHLHFKVARPDGPAWNNPSVPARIKGYGDPLAESLVASPRCDQPRAPMIEAQKPLDTAKPAAAASARPGEAKDSPTASSPSATGSAPAISRQMPAAAPATSAQTGGADTTPGARPSGPVASGTGATE